MPATPSNRRNFLRLTAASIASASLSNPVLAVDMSSETNGPEKSHKRALRFYNTHTQQKLNTVFWNNNRYDQKKLMELNFMLRDHRQNEAAIMDEKLFDQLWLLQKQVGGTGIFEVISGYRSPKTNALLRKRSSGVARNSYHMQGRAIDIRLRGTSLRTVHNTALAMQMGGVGFYPKSNFVHLDTGPVRNW